MGSVFRRGNSWVIEYYVNGKTKREAVGKCGTITKTLAKEILQKRERQIKLDQFEIIETKIPTINEFTSEYITYVRDIKRNRSWESVKYQLKRITDYFGDKKLSHITSKDIDDYKFSRLIHVKPSSVNRELACLSHLFNLAKRQKRFFGENPVSISRLLPENNQVERILTRKEESRLLEASSPELRAIIICALNTGMRKNEILTLKWDNIDIDRNIITLEHINTKNKKNRRIPINSTLRKLILEQKLKSHSSTFIFLSSKGRPYKRHDSLKQAYSAACKRAKIAGLRFHDLRHTAATRMIEAGASIVAVSRILGHADLKTTMRYAHPDESLKDALESISTYKKDSTHIIQL